MSVAIIINPISGGARPGAGPLRARTAMEAVERHGDTPEVFITERPGHARELAKAAAKRGVRLVLAWGGDGTLNEVASALAFGEVPLGLVPSGSGNGLARELGVSQRPAEAIAAALRASPRLMDLGELGGHLFANAAGIGFDAFIASRFNDPSNVRRGLLGYARITSRALLHYVPEDYRVSIDAGDGLSDRSARHAVLVTIANSAQFGNNARIAPAARVDDGLLDLVIMEESSRLRTVMQVPRLFNGTVGQAAGCTITRMRRATIESDRPMTYHVDGETIAGGTTLKARVHPGALWIAA